MDDVNTVYCMKTTAGKSISRTISLQSSIGESRAPTIWHGLVRFAIATRAATLRRLIPPLAEFAASSNLVVIGGQITFGTFAAGSSH